MFCWRRGYHVLSPQLLSPLAAIVVSGSEWSGEAESLTSGPIPSDPSPLISETINSDVTETTEVSECCDLTRQTAPCLSDHVTSPSL